MASNGLQNGVSEPRAEAGLKYLYLVPVVAQKTMGIFGSLYECAKDNLGLLRPGVESVEGTVRTVLGPVYHTIEEKPYELLRFVDQKVDESVTLLGAWLPNGKEILYQICASISRAPEFVFSVVADIQKDGIYQTAKGYYVKYEPVAEDVSYNAWKNLSRLPMVPDVVNVIAPPTIFGVSKLNGVIKLLKSKDVPFASYIPLLPVDKLERAVKSQAD